MDPRAPQPANTDERLLRALRELTERVRRLEGELDRFRKEVNRNGNA